MQRPPPIPPHAWRVGEWRGVWLVSAFAALASPRSFLTSVSCFPASPIAPQLPSNLYKIKFFGDEGYILGSSGVLLKTTSSA